jgi:hypothetical protein
VGPPADPSPFPGNPVWDGIGSRAQTGLDKIHHGLNIASALVNASNDVRVRPSQYRYSTLVERARNLVTIAGQVESAFLAAAEQRDNDAYTALQASRDLATAGAMIGVEDLKVADAAIGVEQAKTQQEKASVSLEHYQELLDGGKSGYEEAQLGLLGTAIALEATASAFTFAGVFGEDGSGLSGVGSALSQAANVASMTSQLFGELASFERRQQEWELQRALAAKDVELGQEQVALAQVQQQIATGERVVAGIQLQHAAATADFLATRFTNTELFDWMSGVLNRVYAYFLQQATALARLAQAQLAFERQEPEQGIVQDDYWQGPPDPQAGSADTTDRRGLTGSARLLQDITRLDQYAFQTDDRKLHLTQTLSVSQFAAQELQQFRQTGVLTFATPLEMFDREFPGHLRLVKRIRLSLLAVVPTVRGIRAQLSASGTSRTVVAAGPFDMVTLRRDPEVIAFTSPTNATGLFELEPDSGMLIPFEGMGVDTVWRLDLPKAANPFDYNLIADVLLTLEYTALDSQEYHRKVVRSLDRGYIADRTFSLRTQFPDAWYDLNNPDTVQNPARPMHVVLPLTGDDFPPHIADLAVEQLAMFVVRDDSVSDELTVTLQRSSNAQSIQAGPVSTIGGVASTRRPGGAPWQVLVGTSPVGTWELQFDDTPAVRSLFSAGRIQDVALVFTISGTTPEWP